VTSPPLHALGRLLVTACAGTACAGSMWRCWAVRESTADCGCKFGGSIVGAVGSLKLGEVWFRALGLLGNRRLSRKGGAGTSKRKL
jgi:hypothetical protein